MQHQNLKFFFLFIGLALIVGMSFPSQVRAHEDELDAAIKNYLLENGDVIMEAVQRYQEKQQQQEEQKAAENVEKHLPFLTSKDAPSVGAENPDVTVVEFFDYNCGYCKRAMPDIIEALKDDTKVRFVFREMPILSPTSMTAAQWALAAQKQGKYFEYHTALMNHSGNMDEAALSQLAKDVGLDVDKMKQDAASEEITKIIEKDMQISQEIGVRGTPAFIINGELHRGYLGPGGLKTAIEQARKNEG